MAENMRVFHVTKRAEDGKWTVKEEKTDDVLHTFDTRDEATIYCEQFAEEKDALIKYHASKGKNKGRIIEVYNSRTMDPKDFAKLMEKYEEENDALTDEDEGPNAVEEEPVKEEKKAPAKKAAPKKEAAPKEEAKEEKPATNPVEKEKTTAKKTTTAKKPAAKKVEAKPVVKSAKQICEERTDGPTTRITVKFLNAADKEIAAATSDKEDPIVSYKKEVVKNGQKAKMVYKNNKCVPSTDNLETKEDVYLEKIDLNTYDILRVTDYQIWQ